MKINSKFHTTLDAYDKFAPQFVTHLEAKVSNIEMDKFSSYVSKKSFILEAGCGSCRDAALLMKRRYKVLGIDASKGLLAEAKKIHPEVETKQMSLTELDFSEKQFDGIWCRATLLHIDRSDVPNVLFDFYKVLKPGGYLYIQTKEGKGEGTQPIPFDREKTRFFTFFEEDELSSLLKEANFEILENYSYNAKDRQESAEDQKWIVIFAKKSL